MASLGTVRFKGKSQREYVFEIYPINTTFNAVGAIYVMTKRYDKDGTNWCLALYVGMTGDLSTRFDDHHKAECYLGKGANVICIHRDDNEQSRRTKETDLIQGLSPTCNG